MNIDLDLVCPHCGAASGGRITRSPGNVLRIVVNVLAVVVCTVATWFPADWRVLRLRCECSHCGGRYYAKTPMPKEPRCGRCRYDLTGNVSGVCPECGWRLTARMKRLVRRKMEAEHKRQGRASEETPGQEAS